MRKLINSTYVTLDGVIQPLDWTSPFSSPEHGTYARDLLFESDALLMGRETYESFLATWPRLSASDDKPSSAGYIDRINSLPKYVASTRLKEPLEWNNAYLIKEDVVRAVAELKQQPGGHVLTYGCGPLAHTLMQHDLVDEFRFWVYPVVAGEGVRLFGGSRKGTLQLVDTKPLRSGVVIRTYQPAKGVGL